MDLVGLYVHSPSKAGRDAGELCGLGRTGITATNSVDDIIALDADCVLYMQQGCDIDDICRILESGKDIVTTRVEFHNPPTLDPEVRTRVERACGRGGTSIYSTGSSPGFITEALPLALLSIQRRLDSLTIDEFADNSIRNSPDLLFNVMGYGQPASAFDLKRMADIKRGFAHSLHMVADAIGAPLDAIDVFGEVALALHDIDIVAGSISRGTVAAQRFTVVGRRKGKPFLTFRANWYCTKDIDADWDLRETGWRVQLEGDAPLDIQIRNPVPPEMLGSVAPNKTPNRAVNAVPFVCAAPPGIRTTVELPHILPYFGP
jgi:4-hydroxy-tetrahydrodipicolinate reductase